VTIASAGRGLNALAALDAASRAVLVTDTSLPDNPISYANSAFTALTGYAEAEVIGRNCRFLQGPRTDPLVVREIHAAVAAGVRIRRDILNYRKDGTVFWTDLTIDPIHDAEGKLTGFVSTQSEADPLYEALEAQTQAEARLENIADHIPGYIYQRVMRPGGKIEFTYCSASISNLLGVPGEDVAPMFSSFVHPDDRHSLTAAVENSAAEMTKFQEEFRLVAADGTAHWMRSSANPRRLADGSVFWDGLAIEISNEKRWQNEIANLALRDPLTGLLTREAWRQALSLRLTGSRQCGLLYADVDKFRDLNRQLGQRDCDQILKQIAKRVEGMAASVAGVAARLGGDEFAILVPDGLQASKMSEIAADLCEDLTRPIEVNAQLLTITTSVGVAVQNRSSPGSTPAEDDGRTLIRQAEVALRWAKQSGPGSYALYSTERDDRVQNQDVLARSLESAIQNDELQLHYQPIVDLGSGRIVSAEALVRWNHPTLGMQSPDLFIPIAEQSGLIVPLGRWVIDRAMRQRAMWDFAGIESPPLAINISGVQLVDTGFVPFVDATLKSMRLKAEDFEFELTETQLIDSSPEVMISLLALHDMGFKIAIDDFGSGYATFRYLRDFPIDKLKIDQLFVRKLVMGSSDALIIRAIISLADSMGIKVVAEGVETDMQRAFLQREGCDIGQGYLFSMPLVAEDFTWIIAGNKRLPLVDYAQEIGGSSAPALPTQGAET